MNAVIYARYSSAAQSQQSIEGQLHDCYAYAERFGINIVGEYIDRAITGRTDERPDFQRMIADARKHQFERILVWKLDRFARSRYDSAIYKRELRQQGVRVMSVTENVGEGDESIIMEAVLEAYAEYYSLDLKRKILRGQRETIAKKLFPGGAIPYGYKLSERHLIIDEATAPNIRYVFESYADGMSMKQIIDELNNRGIRTRLGKKVTYSTFTRSLTNTVYIGKMRYGEQTVEGIADRMISDELFDKVQVRVKATAKAPAANKAKVDYILTGKCFCGHCGSPMTGESGKGKCGVRYYYYACSSRKHHHACNKKAQRKDDLQEYVVRQTLLYVLQQDRMQRIAQSIVKEYEKEFNTAKIHEIERRLSAIERELNNLVDTLAEAPKVAHARIYAKLQSLDAEKTALQIDLSKLRITSSIRMTKSQILSWLRDFCNGDIKDEQFRNHIIDTFVNCVYIYDDRIVIFYNMSNTTSTVTHADLSAELSSSQQKSSDLNAFAPPKSFKSEPDMIFVNRIFGLIFHR